MEDHDVVVRGGMMASESLVGNAQTTMDIEGFFGISVWSLPGLSADQIACASSIRHGKIRVTTVGSIVAAGYAIIPTPQHGRGHHDIELDCLPDAVTCEGLRTVFGEIRENPCRDQKRGTGANE